MHAQSRTYWDEQELEGTTLRIVPLRLDPLYMVNASLGIRLLHDRLNVGVVGYNINAFWGPSYRQHPLTQPVAARILASVGYRF